MRRVAKHPLQTGAKEPAKLRELAEQSGPGGPCQRGQARALGQTVQDLPCFGRIDAGHHGHGPHLLQHRRGRVGVAGEERRKGERRKGDATLRPIRKLVPEKGTAPRTCGACPLILAVPAPLSWPPR
jgi:hypothetical protein